ncbi:MAG: response regulator transcription factor [Clostridia bacterium]|nr:response regulator transcription factor [Clostridia bacterium]
MRIAVCDDEDVIVQELSRLTLSYFSEAGIESEVRTFPDAESLLSSGVKFDILLLDCKLPGVDGVELARQVQTRFPSSEIVFITAYSDYLFESYDVRHLKYILKPVTRERLEKTFDDYLSSANGRKPVFVMADLSIPMNEICYIISKKNNTSVVTGQTSYNSRKTLKEYAGELNPASFMMVKRGPIVNFAHIARHCDGMLTMTDQAVIGVSRRLRSEFLRLYTRYLNETR